MTHRITSFLSVLLVTIFLLTLPITATRDKTIYVKPTQSIQAAIDRADRGDKIVVYPGTYNEQLLITKDDITLIGKPGAILEPPETYVENPCYRLAGNVRAPDNSQTDVSS